jgi:ABC-type antimicrobial peptide transport system permease subunit
VKDAKYDNMRDSMNAQNFVLFDQTDNLFDVTVYVRTQLKPEQMFATVRGTVHDLDANLPVYGMRTLDEQLDQSLVAERLTAFLATVFGFLATLLAAIGLYGVMAYNVGRRTREIGIRIALGAPSPNVLWLVMREVLVMVGLGVAIALPAAWGLARLVQSQLYGIAPSDPMSMGAGRLHPGSASDAHRPYPRIAL